MQVCTKIPPHLHSAQAFALGYWLFSSVLISVCFFIKIKNKNIWFNLWGNFAKQPKLFVWNLFVTVLAGSSTPICCQQKPAGEAVHPASQGQTLNPSPSEFVQCLGTLPPTSLLYLPFTVWKPSPLCPWVWLCFGFDGSARSCLPRLLGQGWTGTG